MRNLSSAWITTTAANAPSPLQVRKITLRNRDSKFVFDSKLHERLDYCHVETSFLKLHVI